MNNKRLKLSSIFSMVLLSLNTQAGAYKCKDANGNITYSQVGCKNEEQAEIIKLHENTSEIDNTPINGNISKIDTSDIQKFTGISTSSAIPPEVQKKIKDLAKIEYPDDYQDNHLMREYFIDEQLKAYQKLQHMASFEGIANGTLNFYKFKAMKEWGDDYRMRVFSIEEQVKEWRQLGFIQKQHPDKLVGKLSSGEIIFLPR